MSQTPDPDAVRGVLLGLACGDALGRPVEFSSAAQIESRHGRVTGMLGAGAHRQPAGTVTDDTEMALALARSLDECGGFDPADVAARFLEWYRSDPFDVGRMTADALRQLDRGASWDEAGRVVWEASPEGQNAGNGSVMRCAPLALAFHDEPERLVETSRDSSRITHHDPRCQYGCAVLNCTVANCLHGDDRPLDGALGRVRPDAPDELVAALDGLPDVVDEAALGTSGYVVETLQTALYHGLGAESADAAVVSAVNMGGDADTIGAVTGAVAGARFGASGLPEEWRDALRGTTADELERVADALLALSGERGHEH